MFCSFFKFTLVKLLKNVHYKLNFQMCKGKKLCSLHYTLGETKSVLLPLQDITLIALSYHQQAPRSSFSLIRTCLLFFSKN